MSINLPNQATLTYAVTTAPVASLDSSGEPCQVCQTEGAVNQVQFYGDQRPDQNGLGCAGAGECCLSCLPRALELADLDPAYPIHVEYEPALVDRHVNTDDPAYARGAESARTLIDLGEGLHHAPVWIRVAELAAEKAHLAHDGERYHRMRGIADALRDYQAERV